MIERVVQLKKRGINMKGKKNPKYLIDVESDDDDDWCFICKDGGELIICEYEGCNKVYHDTCVQEEAICDEIGDGWTCDRHICSECHTRKTPRLNCFCCPYAVCNKCVSSADFWRVKGDGGFCDHCLNLIQLGEEEEPLDDDGNMIDFEDRNTHEGLFKEYWDIIKKKEELTMDDIDTAIQKVKRKKKKTNKRKSHKRGSISDKFYNEDSDDFVMIESDEEELEEEEEDEEPHRPSPKKKVKSKHVEEVKESPKLSHKKKSCSEPKFNSWASKPLINFLKSCGKDTTKPLSISDVEMVIKSYIQEKELVDKQKKSKVRCDDKLYSVFKKKSMKQSDIYYLLEDHFSRKQETSKSEDVSNDDEDTDEENAIVPGMERKTEGSDDESQEKKVDNKIFKPTGFAAIVSENIKLVYLKRSLVEELMKQPKEFERKVTGSFVGIKIDGKKCYQLLPVRGVERSTIGEIFLKVSSMSKGIRLGMLSDFDFTEEECQNLKENFKNGVLKKIPLVEFEEKARSLHEEITNHWISTEEIRLQLRIEFANEKGRRQELSEYTELRAQLKEPWYREKLLAKLPEVTPELVEFDPGTEVVDID